MTWDFVLLSIIWLALASTVLTLYVRIHISEWGLLGLMILLFGAWVLVNRSLMSQREIDTLSREQLYLWRWAAVVGSVIVLIGQIASVIRDPPAAEQVTRRLLIATAVMVVIVFGLNLYLEATS